MVKDLTWKQRKEMINAIDEFGGIMKVQERKTLPAEFVELAMIYAYEMSEEDLAKAPYLDLVTKAMAVFEEIFLKAEAEKKS